MINEMKDSYLKMEGEIENLKKAVAEGNSAKVELAKLQKNLMDSKFWQANVSRMKMEMEMKMRKTRKMKLEINLFQI